MSTPLPEPLADTSGVNWESTIVLVSNDGGKFALSRGAATLSELVTNMLAGQEEDGNKQVEMPVANVASRPLRYAIQFMEHHHVHKLDPIAKPLRGEFKDQLSEFDRAFVYTDLIKNGDESEHQLLIEVALASDFLIIKDLQEVCCAAIAAMIRDKDPKDIPRLLFKSDWVPTEEDFARMRAEKRGWLEEVNPRAPAPPAPPAQ
eukprot:TRINITY_DN40669_c0_g1_i1.p1 TRINITY_DN40669_c0_g1~~TRINITY_DN40669_c0_g1_i1.p1  ORF type:complete len:204 (+),score=44.08 TRINITY_DN40669_c0_g1_i1:33-644(+)